MVDLDGRLGAEDLDRRGVGRPQRVRRHRRRHPPGQELLGLEERVGLGEVALDPADIGQPLLDHPCGRLVPQPEGQRADRGQSDPLVVELAGDEPPAAVEVAHQRVPRDPDVVVVGRGGGHASDGHDRRAGEPLGGGGHHDDRDPLVLGGVGVGAARQPDVVGLVGTARVDLVAVDHPLVTVEHGPRAQRGEVGPGLGLGVADGAVDLPGKDAREEELLLLLGAVVDDHRTHRRQGHERERGPGPLDLGEEDELVGGRATLAAVLDRPADPQPAVGTHLADQPSEGLTAFGLVFELVAHLGSEELGEVGPEFCSQCQLFGRLFEVHAGSSTQRPTGPHPGGYAHVGSVDVGLAPPGSVPGAPVVRAHGRPPPAPSIPHVRPDRAVVRRATGLRSVGGPGAADL